MKRIVALAIVIYATACVNENIVSERDQGAEDRLAVVNIVAALDGNETVTRSILDESSIESKITGVSLASYSAEGKLLDARYYEDGIPSMELWVDTRGGSTLYALVNMGDMTERFPTDEKDVEKIKYVLESFDEVSETGIPMCGIRKNVSHEELPVVIDVERLFAKVRVRILHTKLSGSGTGPYAYNLCNRSLYMRQANSVLSPFGEGGSRAVRKGDIMNISDYIADMNDRNAYEGSLPAAQLGPEIGRAHV